MTEFISLFWESLAPVKEPMIFFAVVCAGLICWIAWGWHQGRVEMSRHERALDVQRRLEDRNPDTLPPLQAFREFPAETPWRPERARAEFREMRRAA